MTVEKNIGYGLKNMKVPEDEIKRKVDWAIVKNQKVFLMDEPLSNLDAKLRVSMRNEISKLHRSLGSTTIYVTHDQVEAMTMADWIVIMKAGVIQQIGKPMDLYEHPVNKFVAGFIGSPQMNFYDVKLEGAQIVFADDNKMQITEELAEKLRAHGDKLILGICVCTTPDAFL